MGKLLASFSTRQRISILAVALATGVGLYALVHWQRESDFRPLFTGLAPEDGAAVVQKLKEAGIEYRLPDEGGSVLVPSARVPELRLNMAASGLPKSGRIGFELFDKTNLGATEFTEHVNYLRALEGELERSVASLAAVEEARVHITLPKDSVFLDAQQPAKASVLVRLRAGAALSPQNVLAVSHLVASAVEGLSASGVSVVDMNGNLLGRPHAQAGLDGPEPSEALLEYRHAVESDLLAKINSTLEPLLGAEKFRAGVSVECDFSGGEQSEEIFDPTHSVMVTSQRAEDSAGMPVSSGIPGTASSLPRPTSRPASGSSQAARMTEDITYQSSRTVKKTRMPAGAIKKMSVAVLLDQDIHWQHDKAGFHRVLAPPPPEKLQIVRNLVAGVTGLNTERGDQITVETLPFESTLTMEPPQEPRPSPPPSRAPKLDRWTMIIAASAAALLLLGMGFLLLRRKRARPDVELTGPAALPVSAPAMPPATLTTSNLEQQIESKLAERDALQQQMEAEALQSLKLAPVNTKTGEVLAKHLRDKIKKDPEVPAHILRSWIREDEN
jgi:flagellar M-ring protein FliF